MQTRKLLPDVSYNEIFQRITFKSYNKYKLVFREGDIGNRFYEERIENAKKSFLQIKKKSIEFDQTSNRKPSRII